MIRRLALLAFVAFFVASSVAWAGRGGRGGGRGRRRARVNEGDSNSRNQEEAVAKAVMRWLANLEEAKKDAGGTKPVMLYIRKVGSSTEKTDNRTLFSNAEVITASQERFAAYRMDIQALDGFAIAKKYGIKTSAGLVWLDGTGNLIKIQQYSRSSRDILDTLTKWPTHVQKFYTELDKNLARARAYLTRDKNTSAALGILIKLKETQGPKGDQVRALIVQVEASGMKLLAAVDKAFKKKRDRYQFLRRIAIEYKGSQVEPRANKMRKGVPFSAVASKVKTPAANTETTPPVKETKTTEAPPSTAPVPAAPGEEASPLPKISKEKAAALLVEAEKKYGEANVIYRKAIEGAPDAQARYVNAFKIFTEALDMAEQVQAAAPSSRVNSLIDKIGFARYACFKYQTF